ncbi:hypothetical protein CVT26_009278 [Gymnopilus dilepis]|uniref:Cytochrome P450 n=1 Tax=Gymnopilus dilepis TaxID=231916 RepID=A0A409YAG9_9AGAR|nr:hypothetical protein CVT26_009278 [Gymnopilus dilepis]
MTANLAAADILVVCIVLFGTIFFFGSQSKTALPLPPGPRKLPILGNLLDLPTKFEWETFQAWSKRYGSGIVHASVVGQSIIILNSVEAARDLLEKRSSTYSDSMGLSWVMVFMRYGPEWKDRRRLFQRHFHPTNEKIHKPREVRVARSLLLQILENPEHYMDHVRHSVGGLLYSISYGSDTQSSNDPILTAAEDFASNLSEGASPATMVVDIFPFLNYMPSVLRLLFGNAFAKSKQQWRESGRRLHDAPFLHALKGLAEGNVQPSFVSHALEDIKSSNDTEAQQSMIKDVAGVVIIGGSTTTTALIHTFFLAMLCFPDAQSKAQEELDRVVGRNSLPDFSDESELPYLNALLKEIHRWQPSGPLGIPHFIEQEDEYQGYRIPKQSVVIANVWSMLHDEERYPNPDSFRPERFLKDGRLDPLVFDPTTVVFGFGRRICPGAHIAQSILFIVAASVLSAFRISPATDEKGQIIEPTVEFRSAVTV